MMDDTLRTLIRRAGTADTLVGRIAINQNENDRFPKRFTGQTFGDESRHKVIGFARRHSSIDLVLSDISVNQILLDGESKEHISGIGILQRCLGRMYVANTLKDDEAVNASSYNFAYVHIVEIEEMNEGRNIAIFPTEELKVIVSFSHEDLRSLIVQFNLNCRCTLSVQAELFLLEHDSNKYIVVNQNQIIHGRTDLNFKIGDPALKYDYDQIEKTFSKINKYPHDGSIRRYIRRFNRLFD